MKQLKIIGILLFIVISSACSDDDNNTQTLSGIYTETSPVSGRSQLNFINGNTVVKSEVSNSIQDEFTYEIIGNVIKLTPNWKNATAQEFEIKIMNNSKFEIENLYPSVGINPTTFIEYEK